MHLVMVNEGGRTAMRRVSTAEYAELKAARMAKAEATIAPAAAEGLVRDDVRFTARCTSESIITA